MRGKNIARYGVSLVLSLCLLSGCASKAQWTKPGFNPDESKQDFYLCEREANILASQQAGAMASAVNPILIYALTKKKFFNNCMEAKGYQRFKSDKERELIEGLEEPLSPSIGDQGDRWKHVGSTGKKGGNHWFIDTQTISYLTKDVVRVWVKATLDEEGRLLFQHTTKSPKNLRYVFTLLDIDCPKCAHKTLKMTFYRMDGVLIDSSDFPLDEPWRPIDPGSMFMIVYREICFEKKSQIGNYEKPTEKKGIYSDNEIKGWYRGVEEWKWRKISESENTTYCYDTRNIRYPSKGIVRVYTIIYYESKKAINDMINHYQQLGLSKKGYENLYGTVTLQEINCNNKMYLPIFFMDYDKNRNPLNQSYDLSSNGWSEISSTMPPLEKLYKVVCPGGK